MRAWLRQSCSRRLNNTVILIPPPSFIRVRASHYDHQQQQGNSEDKKETHGHLNSRVNNSNISSNINDIAALLSRGAEAENVTVHGWVRSVRRQKKIAFAVIGDGSSLDSVQAVLKPEDAALLSPGAAVRISGPWCASPGSGQPHELRASHVQVLGENDAEHHPIQPKFHTSEYLRTIPHLRSRIPAHALRLRLRSHVIASATSYFHAQGFVQTHPPIITSSDCEGAGEVFVVSPNSNQQPHPTGDEWDQAPLQPGEQHQYFFRTPKYLTVSAQLHLEALAHAVTRVWTLSPAFRAERSDTPRHLSEFYMLEAELCFTQTLEDVMTVLEGLLSSIAADLHRSVVGDELLRSHHADDGGEGVTPALLAQRWVGMYSTPWPRITYADAISLLQRAVETGQTSFVVAPSYDVGLQAEHERHLAATLGGREQRPVFVTDYPRKQKAFYMSPSSASALSSEDDEGDDGTAACFDLLVPSHCELAGGSLREHRAAALEAALRARGLGEGGGLEWYGDLRRYGAAPHGGFGLGFDRLLAYLAGVGNVRDVVAFPRWVGRCVC